MKSQSLFLILSSVFLLTSCFGGGSSYSSRSSSSSESISTGESTSSSSSSEEEAPEAGAYFFDESSEEIVGEGVSILTGHDDYGNTLRVKVTYQGQSCFEVYGRRAIYNLDPIEGVADMSFNLGNVEAGMEIFAVTSSNPLDENVLMGGFDDVAMKSLYYGESEGTSYLEFEEMEHQAYFCLFTTETMSHLDERMHPLQSFVIKSAHNEVSDPTGIPYSEYNEGIQDVCRFLFGREVPLFNGSGIHAVSQLNEYIASFKHHYFNFSLQQFRSDLATLGFRELQREGGPSRRHEFYLNNGLGWSKYQTILIDVPEYTSGGVSELEIYIQSRSHTETHRYWPAEELATLFGSTVADLLPAPDFAFQDDRFVISLGYNGDFSIRAFYDSSDDAFAAEAICHYAQQLYNKGFRKAGGSEGSLYHKDLGVKVELVANYGDFRIEYSKANFTETFPMDLLVETLDPHIDEDAIPVLTSELGAYYCTDGSAKADHLYSEDELFLDAYAYIRIFDVNEEAYNAYRELFESTGAVQGDAWKPAFVSFSDINDDGSATIYIEAGLDEHVKYVDDFVPGLVSNFISFTGLYNYEDECSAMITSAFPQLVDVPENTCDSWADWKTITGIYVDGIGFDAFCEGINATHRLYDDVYVGVVTDSSNVDHKFIMDGYDTVSGCHIAFAPYDDSTIESFASPASLLAELEVDASLAILPEADAYALSGDEIKVYYHDAYKTDAALEDYHDDLVEAGYELDPYTCNWIKAIAANSYFVIEEDLEHMTYGFATASNNSKDELLTANSYHTSSYHMAHLGLQQSGVFFYLAPGTDTEAEDQTDFYVGHGYSYKKLMRELRVMGFTHTYISPKTFKGIISETHDYDYTVEIDDAHHLLRVSRALVGEE